MCCSFSTVSKLRLLNAAFKKIIFVSEPLRLLELTITVHRDNRHHNSIFNPFRLIMITFVTGKHTRRISRRCVCSTKKTEGKSLKTQRQECALMAVGRYYARDFLPSAVLGAQQGAHGAGCTKIVALLRILVSLAGHGSLGRET